MQQSLLARMLKIRIFRKSPVAAYLRLNEQLWRLFPTSLAAFLRPYAASLHALARLSAIRRQNGSTYFFRNRPELELIRRLADQKHTGATLRIAVLGCSNGAEVYSILWTILSARPDLNVVTHAVDISEELLKFAQKGVYSLEATEFFGAQIFERIAQEEMRLMFDREGHELNIRSWIMEGITWHPGDARDPDIINVLGPQDIVVANRFLCHMDPPDAEKCLRNIARLVSPRGFLFVSGIDLDIRTKVAHDLGWQPVRELMEQIHEGDRSLRDSWPWGYWGLEPFNKRRRDWKIRYVAAFRLWVNRSLSGLWLSKVTPYFDTQLDLMDFLAALLEF